MNSDFETQLRVFQNNFELFSNSKDDNGSIRDDLKSISIYLNNGTNENKIIEWDFLVKFKTITALNTLFEHFVDKLEDKLFIDDVELINPTFNNLIIVVNKISLLSIKCVRLFSDEGLFEIFLKFFRKILLLECLFEANVPILMKMLNIFCQQCKSFIHFDVFKELSEENIIVLIKSRDLVEKLTKSDDRFGSSHPVYQLYFISICYLQGIQSKTLVSLAQFENLSNKLGFIHNYFGNVRPDFSLVCKLVECQFKNELGQFEIAKSHKFSDTNIGTYENYLSLSPFLNILESVRMRSSSKQTKAISFSLYKNWFKSIVYYGLDAERIYCLWCLSEFCQENESIKMSLLNDETFVRFLLNLRNESREKENTVKERLFSLINSFF